MKFTDGYWQLRPGVTAHFPVHVHEVEVEPEALTVYGPTRRLNHRGDTLNLPLLTVRFSSPMPDVIRVQLYHHKGRRLKMPAFELQPQPAPGVLIADDPKAATLTSGRLTVRIEKAADWRIEFKDGERVITGSGWRGMGSISIGGQNYIHEQLNLAVGECVYGLGERFTPFVKNGQSVDLWNEDGGTSSEQAYKNVPFFLTNRGYGVFVNHPERVSLEVASEKVERVQFSVPGEYLEYYLIYGPSPKQVLQRYTALTGRPALPPAWSFGLWLTTSFTTDYDEATVTSFVQGMVDRDLPLHVFHFDCFWMKEFHWVDFEWDRARVSRSTGHAAAAQGARPAYLRVDQSIYRPALGAVRRRDAQRLSGKAARRRCLAVGSVAGGHGAGGLHQPRRVPLVRRQAARADRHGRGLLQDRFRRAHPDRRGLFRRLRPGSRCTTTTLISTTRPCSRCWRRSWARARRPCSRARRPPAASSFPVHWGGDCNATFESMAESLRGGLSLCLSGFGFWSHDIGGFEQTAPAEVYKRWCAFGLLSSHSRLHGSSSYRVPWLYDEEAVDVLRYFTKLKCRLMPYLFGAGPRGTRRRQSR